MPELNLDLASYLLTVYKIDVSKVSAKDIPNLVLHIMQYIEERMDKGYNKRDFVLEQVSIIAQKSRLTDQDLAVVNSLIETYIALDKSVEVIHKISDSGCCIIV